MFGASSELASVMEFGCFWATVSKMVRPTLSDPLSVCLMLSCPVRDVGISWVGSIKMPLGMEVGLGRGHTVLDGDPVPPSKKGHSSPSANFAVYVCCGKKAGWIKMPLGMKVGLGPGHILLDGDLAPSRKGAQQPPPLFGPSLLWPNGRPSQKLPSSCLALLWYDCVSGYVRAV